MFEDYKNVYSFTWTIENFSFCHHRTRSSLYCSFIDKNINERIWRLELYPRGYNEESSSFISCFLNIFNLEIAPLKNRYYENNVDYGFKIEIIGASGNKLKSREQKLTLPHWSSSKFLEISKVSEDAKNSANDMLTVHCYVYGNNADKEAFDSNIWRSKILVDRLHCSWEKNIMVEKTLQENFVFPKNTEFKIVLSMVTDALKVSVVKLNSKSFTDHFVECKLTLLACDVYDELQKTINYLCTQKATHYFKSRHFSRPETWEFPSDIISNKLIEHSASAICKTSFSYKIICEFLCSNGLEDILPETKTNGTTVAKMYPTLQEDLQSMFVSKKYCDIKLRVDNEVIEAHKNVLTARSPVFSTMFDQNMIESNTGIIDIVDINIDTMYLFLEFLYTDAVNKIDLEQAKALILAAEKYQVLSLKEMCSNILHCEMSPLNVCEILTLADTVAHSNLKSAAIKFIDDNSKTVLTSVDWTVLKKNHRKLAIEVCASFAEATSLLHSAESASISENVLQEKRRRIE